MAHPAADIRAEVQSAYPGAIVYERGRNWIRHQHPTDPRKFILDTCIGPLHINGTNTEINTDWQAVGGAWQYQMITADFHAFSRDTLGVGTMYRYQDPATGEYVEFQPLALNWVNNANDSRQQITQPQSVAAQMVRGDILRFPNGYGAGRHLEYQAQTAGLKKTLTIDAPANLPAPTVANPYLEIEFIIVKSSGVAEWIDTGSGYQQWDRSTKTNTVNRVEYRTSGGAVLWQFGLPIAWDSNRNVVTGIMQFRRQGANRYCTVRVPKTWLDTATFPIRLDPTIDAQVGASLDDCGRAGAAFNNTGIANEYGNNGGNVSEGAHRWTGISGLSGATIDVSWISLYYDGGFAGSALLKVRAENAAAPAQITTYDDFIGRALTTAGVDWDGTWTTDIWNQSPSLNPVFQELANSLNPTVIQVFVKDDGSTSGNYNKAYTYDIGAWGGANLHIDYTAGGGAAGLKVRRALMGVGV